ncbi:hypothetical protein BpHYR1_013579 [Brachionus plicatilis]|uniref:Uncharacterized protein n=1 Tax=Brachionus plicatilis TaxID=10195 RepID=A0A3M7Q9V4_BRAPC|nr:hypothetical protein BpHYR1_013579 [Brachionus plicatilis]
MGIIHISKKFKRLDGVFLSRYGSIDHSFVKKKFVKIVIYGGDLITVFTEDYVKYRDLTKCYHDFEIILIKFGMIVSDEI